MHNMNQPSDDRILNQAINSLKSMQMEMSASTRSRLARRCAQELVVSPVGMLERIRTFFALYVPQAPLATALGVMLMFVVTAVLLSNRMGAPKPASEGSQVRLISLQPDRAGAVTLEWRDGGRRVYHVLKSDNPRDFSKAASYRVQGNRWTDTSGTLGKVTYYRVE
jgi:hypothetical protein